MSETVGRINDLNESRGGSFRKLIRNLRKFEEEKAAAVQAERERCIKENCHMCDREYHDAYAIYAQQPKRNTLGQWRHRRLNPHPLVEDSGRACIVEATHERVFQESQEGNPTDTCRECQEGGELCANHADNFYEPPNSY